jgi:hypothetical protein
MTEANESEKVLIGKLQDIDVLQKDIKSKKFGSHDVKLVKRSRDKKGNVIYSWRCRGIKCLTYQSVKKNSYFKLIMVMVKILMMKETFT